MSESLPVDSLSAALPYLNNITSVFCLKDARWSPVPHANPTNLQEWTLNCVWSLSYQTPCISLLIHRTTKEAGLNMTFPAEVRSSTLQTVVENTSYLSTRSHEDGQ